MAGSNQYLIDTWSFLPKFETNYLLTCGLGLADVLLNTWALSCRGLPTGGRSRERASVCDAFGLAMKRCLGTLSIIFLLLVFLLVPLQSDPEISSPRAGSGGEASALGLSIVSFRILAPRGETDSQGFKKLTGSWKDRDIAINAGKSSAEASLHRSAAIISQC